MYGNRLKPRVLATDPEFRRFREEHLGTSARQLGRAREDALRLVRSRGLIALVALGALGFVLYQWFFPRDEFGSWLVLVLALAGPLVLLVWAALPLLNQRKEAKQRVVAPLVGYFGDFEYQPTGQIALRALKDWRLLEDADQIKYQDTIAGSYLGVPVTFSELSLSRRGVETGSERSRVHIFKGAYLEFELAEDQGPPLVAMSKTPFFATHALRREWTSLESPDGRFELAAVNEPNPRGFPKPLFEVMEHLRAGTGAGYAMAAVGGRTLVILLEGASNAFEPPLTGELDVTEEAEKVRARLALYVLPVEDGRLDPSVDARDEPRSASAPEHAPTGDDAFSGMGCTPLIVLNVVFMAAYGWLLRDSESRSLALLLALCGSPLLASAVTSTWHSLRDDRFPIGWGGLIAKLAFALGPLWYFLR